MFTVLGYSRLYCVYKSADSPSRHDHHETRSKHGGESGSINEKSSKQPYRHPERSQSIQGVSDRFILFGKRA